MFWVLFGLWLVLCFFAGAALVLIGEQVFDALRGVQPYAPEFAEHCDDTLDAFGFQRSEWVTGDVPYVDSGHPKDCDRVCCSEERLTERVQAFPWDTYEQELTY